MCTGNYTKGCPYTSPGVISVLKVDKMDTKPKTYMLQMFLKTSRLYFFYHIEKVLDNILKSGNVTKQD